MEQYFFSGHFYACYKAAIAQPNNEQAQRFIHLFERFQYHLMPSIQLTSEPEVEFPDETYKHDKEVNRIRLIKDEVLFQQAVKNLERIASQGTEEEKASSFYTQGKLFLFAHHYQEAVYCFTQAVQYAPNDAVYNGILGQTIQRLNYSPFEVMLYIDRALQLDCLNARWHWNKGLVMLQLYKDLQEDPFLEQAIVSLEEAQKHCRKEQKSLATAISNTFDTIRDILIR